MKTPYRIAQELGVSPQAVYKKLTPDFLRQYAESVEVVQQQTKSGIKTKYRLGVAAEAAVKLTFVAVQQQSIELDDVSLLNQLNRLNSENEFLRSQLEGITAALLNEQRAHDHTRRLLPAPAAGAPKDAPPTNLFAWLAWRRGAKKGD